MRYGECKYCGKPSQGIVFVASGEDICEACTVVEIKWRSAYTTNYGAVLPFCDACNENLAHSRDSDLGVVLCKNCTDNVPYFELLSWLLPGLVWISPE